MFGRKKDKKNESGKSSVKKQNPAQAKTPVAKNNKTVSEKPAAKQSSSTQIFMQNSALTEFVANEDHYEKVIERIKTVKNTLWIGTADIKDLYVKDGQITKPLLEVLSELVKKGVAVRLIHAKEPGPAFRKDFDKYPELIDGIERALCPRVHFKMIIYDFKAAYVGSANLTGAGLGMKGENTRNFEAGILSSDPSFIKAAAIQFDKVWMGSFCRDCKRKDFCTDPIISYSSR